MHNVKNCHIFSLLKSWYQHFKQMIQIFFFIEVELLLTISMKLMIRI